MTMLLNVLVEQVQLAKDDVHTCIMQYIYRNVNKQTRELSSGYTTLTRPAFTGFVITIFPSI